MGVAKNMQSVMNFAIKIWCRLKWAITLMRMEDVWFPSFSCFVLLTSCGEKLWNF